MRARLDGGLEDRQFLTRLLRVGEERRYQGTDLVQLFDEEGDPLFLAARLIVRAGRDGFEQLRDHALMHIGILAQIERGEMEAETACCAPQRPQAAAGEKLRAMQLQRLIDDVQVAAEFVGIVIGGHRLANGLERIMLVDGAHIGRDTAADGRHSAAIGLRHPVRGGVGELDASSRNSSVTSTISALIESSVPSLSSSSR